MTTDEFDSALSDLETRVDRLRALYENWFRGYEKTEPTVARKEVERRVYALRKELPRNTALRFRYHQLYLRYTSLTTYWQRSARQIEDGTHKLQLQRMRRRNERTQRRETPKQEREGEEDTGPRSYELDLDETLNVDDLLDDLELDEVAKALDTPGPHSEPPPRPAPRPAPVSRSFGRAKREETLPSLPPVALEDADLPPFAARGRPLPAADDIDFPEPPTMERSLPAPLLPAAGARRNLPFPPQAPGTGQLRAPAPANANASSLGGPPGTAPAKPGLGGTGARPAPPAPAGASATGAGRPAQPAPTGPGATAVGRPAPAPAGPSAPGAGRPAPAPAGPSPLGAGRPAQAPLGPNATGVGRPAQPVPPTPGQPLRAPGGPNPTAAGLRQPPTPGGAPAQPSPSAGGVRPGQPARRDEPSPAANTTARGPAGQPLAPTSPQRTAAGIGPAPARPAAGPPARPAVNVSGNTIVGRPPLSSPLASATTPSEQQLKRIYDEYTAARRRNNEGEIRYETMVDSIQKMLPELTKKHQGRPIDFEVVVKDGRVGLKPKAT